MGRRKSSAAGSEFDAESMGSVDRGSRASGGGRRGQRGFDPDDDLLGEVDAFDAAVEQLYEKRASVREGALSAIVGMLAQFRYEDCAFKEDTLTQLCLSSIRRGKEREASLAAKALGLHVVTLGASQASERIYDEAQSLLEPMVLTGKNGVVRAAVVEALSLLCFVGSEGTHETLRTMGTLWRAVLGGWKKAAAAPMVVAALRGWAFLLTTVPAHRLDSHFVETHLGLLAQLLNGGDVDVRGAAGEAIALLWHMGDLNSLPESPRPPRGSSSRGGTPTASSLVALAVGSPRTPRLAAALAQCASSPHNGGTAAPAEPQAAADGFGAAEAWAAAAASAAPAPREAGEHEGAAVPPPQLHIQTQVASSSAAQRREAPAGGGKGDAAASSGDDDDDDDPGEEEEEEEEVDSLEAIVERMRDLARNRGDASRLNKGDRAASRGMFRDLLAIIEGTHVPEQKVKLRHGDQLLVNGLPDNIRLDYLRAYLGEAFQAHLQSNELLHQVFQFQPAYEPEERLTPLEKRLFKSKSSGDVRDRTELRRRERSQMASYKHGSLAAD